MKGWDGDRIAEAVRVLVDSIGGDHHVHVDFSQEVEDDGEEQGWVLKKIAAGSQKAVITITPMKPGEEHEK